MQSQNPELKNRYAYLHENRLIYEWEESLDSITMFVEAPPIPSHIKISSVIEIIFKSNNISIGIKGNPPYLSHQTEGVVDSEESLWYTQESPKNPQKKELVIEIQKGQKGVRWGCVFKGHKNLNSLEEEELKKKMMKERFQEEHPGFDFSGAEFNGNVPDARSFMGGMKNV